MNGSEPNQEREVPTNLPEAPKTEEKSAEPRVSTFVKTFAIVGFIAIVVLAAWMSIQVIRVTPGALSAAVVSITSIFRGSDELDLTLSTRVVNAGTEYPVTVSFDGADDRLAFSYECTDDVTFSTKTEEGVTPIACEEAYPFVGTTLTVVASSTAAHFADVMITVESVTEDPVDSVSDSALLTIVTEGTEVGTSTKPVSSTDRPAEPTTGTAPTPVTPGTPTTVTREVEAPRSDPNGTPDLKVTIVGTGVVNKKDGKEVFVAMDELPNNKRAAVKFIVENIGTKTSEEWKFAATLPIEGDEDYEYNSKDQAKLRPGDKIEFTLSFNEVVEDEDRATVKIELDVDGKDAKDSNNIATKSIRFED